MKRSAAAPTVSFAAWPHQRWLLALLARAGGGLLLFVLLYQIPVRHTVSVGYNDAAYVQGFNDPVNRWDVIDEASAAATPLRWSKAQSFLLFPQIGLPAQATLRWRALRAPSEPLPSVRVLLNGRYELGTFQSTGDWETHRFMIDRGLLKANDLFLELRTDPVVVDDGVEHGVQVAAASLATTSWPIMPYPAQLLYGTAAIVFGTALVRGYKQQLVVALLIGLLFLLLYRLPLTPYPLRTWPPLLVVGLATAWVIRLLPQAQLGVVGWAWPLLVLGVISLWFAWLVITAQRHVTLSVPGVERDFPVFATRATTLRCPPALPRATAPCVLRADGFYQIGYPLLLWLVKPWTGGDAFVAGRLIAAVSGALLLLGTAALGWRCLPTAVRGGASLLAVLVLAFSPFVVQYSLYVGTDMPFAAAWTLGLAAVIVPQRHTRRSLIFAGGLCGLAFLVRHPGLVLLPFGVVALLLLQRTNVKAGAGLQCWAAFVRWSAIGWFVLGWLLSALPQLLINVVDTGQPLYSQQAKNVWLAVYGDTDYSGRWHEATDDVRLRDIVLADPQRFFANWARNLQGFVGTGAEDTREFGQALGLRLLHVPANWLAVGGLGLWAWRCARPTRLLVVGGALYVVGVSVGFVLPRFFLPLAPIMAVAAATALVGLAEYMAQAWPRLDRAQWLGLLGVLLVASMASGPRVGARYVLDHQVRDARTSNKAEQKPNYVWQVDPHHNRLAARFTAAGSCRDLLFSLQV